MVNFKEMKIKRDRLTDAVLHSINRFSVTILLGPRRCGKTYPCERDTKEKGRNLF